MGVIELSYKVRNTIFTALSGFMIASMRKLFEKYLDK
jgi:hypothetical protein